MHGSLALLSGINGTLAVVAILGSIRLFPLWIFQTPQNSICMSSSTSVFSRHRLITPADSSSR